MNRIELEALTEEQLDELVHDAKGNEAAAINNGGKDAQIDYLLGAIEDAAQLHEVMRVLVLSTSHIEQSSMEELEACIGGRAWAGAVYPDGAFVHVPEDKDNEFGHDCVDAVLAYARQHSYEWIRLDSDGPTVEGLPVHEWR